MKEYTSFPSLQFTAHAIFYLVKSLLVLLWSMFWHPRYVSIQFGEGTYKIFKFSFFFPNFGFLWELDHKFVKLTNWPKLHSNFSKLSSHDELPSCLLSIDKTIVSKHKIRDCHTIFSNFYTNTIFGEFDIKFMYHSRYSAKYKNVCGNWITLPNTSFWFKFIIWGTIDKNK